jgi:hypothetical protein
VHDWVNLSAAPLVRFTGQKHDYTAPVNALDLGKEVSALGLVISTGNDDLRGGSNSGDNCNVIVQFASGKEITLTNVNVGKSWDGWSSHTIPIPLPAGGSKGGDIRNITLHTGFGGDFGG